MAEIKVNHNYIYTKKLKLDLISLKNNCDIMYEFIKKQFSKEEKHFSGRSTMTTQLYGAYNLLLYPLDGFHELYNEIKTMFYAVEQNHLYEKYYIQCWLNYYRKGEFIDWHSHWKPEDKSWHGFFCLDTENSYTSYKIPNNINIIDVKSENNLLIMNKSDGDLHKSSVWVYADRPRITIAFDIVPRHNISYDNYINHWIPI